MLCSEFLENPLLDVLRVKLFGGDLSNIGRFIRVIDIVSQQSSFNKFPQKLRKKIKIIFICNNVVLKVSFWGCFNLRFKINSHLK